MRAALEFSNLTLGYDRHPAVHHLSGSIREGALLAVIGPNGGGKSTLLKAIAGRIAPLGGSITRSSGHLAYMPQIGDLSRDFPISVFDMALTGLCSRRGMFGRIARGDREHALAALNRVGLSGFENRPIRTLSGGQVQRLLFARLMLQDAPLILLDEPFAAIDQRTTGDLLDIIARWHAEGRTVLTVAHDLTMVSQHFPESLLLARECIGWGKTSDVVRPDLLARARQMSEAFDQDAAWCERAA
jgi:zinc/manganese transport system ATP-binding protein